MSLKKTPFFEIRSGTVDLLHFVVKTADLTELRVELGRRFESTPSFFAGESVAIDIRRLDPYADLQLDQVEALLATFRMRVAGVVAQPDQRAWAEAQGAPLLESREPKRGDQGHSAADEGSAAYDAAPAVPGAPENASDGVPPEAPPTDAGTGASAVPMSGAAMAASAAAAAAPRRPTMIIDRPLRSGQRVYADGDLVVMGLVSNGAEVIAEGNIHIYAPLRGRALAGVHGNHEARIFCTCLEPELISIAGIYRTTETPLADDVRGKAVQVSLENEKLIFEPIRLT